MLFLTFFLLLVCEHVLAELVVLKDAKGNDKLTNFWPEAKGACSSSSWTFLNNYFATCYSNIDNNLPQNCTLKTLSYDVTDANLVYINIEGETRSCKSQLTTNTNCRETFNAYATFKNNVAEADNLKYVATIPSLAIPLTDKFNNKNETYPVKTDGFKLITFGFRSEYYCGSITTFNVFYYKCPASSNNLVDFTSVAAPAEGTNRVPGRCTSNAVSVDSIPLSMNCKFDGTSVVTGSCKCSAGHTKRGNQCIACKTTEFKETSGNEACSKCGFYSTSFSSGFTTCACDPGFYRAVDERGDSAKPCHKIPAVISGDVNVNEITGSSANISWTSDYADPDFDGFIVVCEKCDPMFERKTTETYIKLDDLSAFTNYNMTVAIIDSNTNLTQRTNTKMFSFTTLIGVLPAIGEIRKNVNEDGSVLLQWDMPPGIIEPDNVVFVIKYDGKEVVTKKLSYLLTTGSEDKNFKVEVYLQIVKGGNTYKGVSSFTVVSIPGGVGLGLVVGVVAAIIILLIVVFIIVFCVWKRRHPAYLQVVRMEDGTVKLPNRFLKLPGGKQLYVDPTTYNAVDDAVTEFANEIRRNDLHVGQMLGGGEFAEVYKGTLVISNKNIPVAIKTLRSGATKKDRDDFLGEAAILGQFNDPNVIVIEGVILKDHPNMIVLEFMSNGALDKYLQQNDTKFTVLQLLGMARGVASGMKYLSELGYIHRDVAARNILVDDRQICKVSDFGMSREIKVDETYDTQGGKIPVRWTAPESIQFRKFTTASDVWSYGVLLWEIVSFGERPYWDWGNYEVVERINAGYRLPPPMHCPKVLHDLMLTCWYKDRQKRPKFNALRDTLEKWIRNPESLQEIASVITKTDENLDYTVLQTINKWLQAIGMDKYTSNFVDQGFATPRQILELTESDLEALGIGPIGHRKKIYKAIKNTQTQVESRHSSLSGRKKLTSFSQKR